MRQASLSKNVEGPKWQLVADPVATKPWRGSHLARRVPSGFGAAVAAVGEERSGNVVNQRRTDHLCTDPAWCWSKRGCIRLARAFPAGATMKGVAASMTFDERMLLRASFTTRSNPLGGDRCHRGEVVGPGGVRRDIGCQSLVARKSSFTRSPTIGSMPQAGRGLASRNPLTRPLTRWRPAKSRFATQTCLQLGEASPNSLPAPAQSDAFTSSKIT